MSIVNLNVVPEGTPRKSALPKGILYRFGFKPIEGSGLCRVGECVLTVEPTKEYLRDVIEKYCKENGIDEKFIPADYGFTE